MPTPEASHVVFVHTEQVIRIRVKVSERPMVLADQYWSMDGKLLAQHEWNASVQSSQSETPLERLAREHGVVIGIAESVGGGAN